LGEIFLGESAGAAGVDERADAETVVECGEGGFWKQGELEEEHVPTAAELAEICFEVADHDGGMRDVEDGEF